MSLLNRTSPRLRAFGAFIAATSLVAVTSCTPTPEPTEQVSDPAKVLQTVHVSLTPSAGVSSVKATEIHVAADGNSSSAMRDYKPQEVVGDLPVRVSAQYRAAEKSGADLADLTGYTGRLELTLTIENLTVKPQEITYDVAGQARTETTLVGAPMTVAASTKLAGLPASKVVAGAPDGNSGTNGLLSSAPDGSAVVQWATVLSPPRSGASSTLRLVADVEDFKAPTIDVAVQPGLTTDLSAEGVLSSTFADDPNSELSLQKRTISLITDVNSVLTNAGGTITDLRRNLQTTSKTLGTKTAKELAANSKTLASTMQGLKGQLKQLKGSLDSTTKGTQSAVSSQLQKTVSALDSMLGDTSVAPPSAAVKGGGCGAEVAKPGKSATVYQGLLTMASQLDAYAATSAACRDGVVEALQGAIGPEKPSLEKCKDRPSMTCSLFGSSVTVGVALLGLVQQGDELVKKLQPAFAKNLDPAIADQNAVSTGLTNLDTAIGNAIKAMETDGDFSEAKQKLDASLKAADDTVKTIDGLGTEIGAAETAVNELHKQFKTIFATATSAKAEIDTGRFLDKSMKDQTTRLADELCGLTDSGLPRAGTLSQRQIDELRAYLTSKPCKETDDEGNPVPPLSTPAGYSDPLDIRLDKQARALETIVDETDTTEADAGIAAKFTTLNTSITKLKSSLESNLKDIKKALDGVGETNSSDVESTISSLKEFRVAVQEANKSTISVGTHLDALKKQQDEINATIKQAFSEVSSETYQRITKLVDGQIRDVKEFGDEGTASVAEAFNRSVSGLRSTSSDVVNDAKDTVQKQQGELDKQGAALDRAIDEQTKASLAGIADSTRASTRDVEGANKLLISGLGKVMLDLGDRKVNGSGLLGSMTTSAAKADTADYQLALATQNAEGYANIRSQDVAGILLRQAQFRASVVAADTLPAFHMKTPAGATSQTLYTLSIGPIQ